ncbi:hypothetical protein B7463_g1652, partial [Scytalidium lignicola]
MTSDTTFRFYKSAQAEKYAGARPSYSPMLYEHIFAKHAASGGGFGLVIDVGCGPGSATRDLAPAFEHAVGLDPGEGMINVARERGGETQKGEKIRFEVSEAERIASVPGLPLGEVDLITAATAAHWFDMKKFWGQAAQLLKPGGTVAIWLRGRSYAHPDMPHGAEVNKIQKAFELVLEPYMLPGNRLSYDLYDNLVLPWTADPTQSAFPKDKFQRFEWDRNGLSDGKDFFGGSREYPLEVYEQALGTVSAVTRWREAHPELVGTEKDCVKVMIAQKHPIRWEALLRRHACHAETENESVIWESRAALSAIGRLGRPCHYRRLRHSNSNRQIQDTSLLNKEAGSHRALEPPTPSSLSFFSDGLLMEEGINNEITKRLSHAIGDVTAIRIAAVKYFRTIHLWFPIISEISFYERLSNILLQPSAAYSLLSLSMALITTIPKDNEKMLSLYFLLKSSIAIVEAGNINSLEVVQARLLVSLFEVGHGMDPAAFISLAATARAAVAIGLNQTVKNRCVDNTNVLSRSEQGHRVWWGLVMVDRTYTLERGKGPCATEGFDRPQFLPRDGNIWNPEVLSSSEPLSLSTPSSIRVGPFARQAQVSHILDILMMHLYDSDGRHSLNKDESDQIARTLTAFSMLLPEETPQPWPTYCGAIGMCYSALITLHESQPKTSLDPDAICSDAPESLQSTLNRLALISKKFNDNIRQIDIEGMSPFPPHGITRAALLQYRLWKETGDIKYCETANVLTVMVKHFSKRWMRAAHYLCQLEAEQPLLTPMFGSLVS